MKYTIDDLNVAKCHLMTVWTEWENYYGTNPAGILNRLKQARHHVQRIELELKSCAVISKSGHTRLFRELNKKYPNAKTQDTVDHMGKSFRRTFETCNLKDEPQNAVNWGEKWVEV